MGWTTPKTWSVGEVVTAANMNLHLRDNLNALYQVAKMKASNETVNNSTTLQNDDDFFFSVLANEKWAVHLALILNSPATPDWKANWTKPAGTTISHAVAYNTVGTFNNWITTDASALTDGTDMQVHLYAAVVVSSTAGTVQFQWAQNTLDASNTIVKAGSFMIATRMA